MKASRYGWMCPQCGRVWSPEVIKCEPCEKIATKGYGITTTTTTGSDSCEWKDANTVCTYYNNGRCDGTKDCEPTNCEGNGSKCDKYHSDWR